MKLRLKFITLALCAQIGAMAADNGNSDVHDFDLGTRVGNCIAVKCQVFQGHVLDEAPGEAETITVKVNEWLFGAPPASGTVAIPYRDRSRSGGWPYLAWDNVKFSRNMPLTVVLGAGQGWGVSSWEPLVVAASEREAQTIRALAQHVPRLQDHPELIPDEVASLSRAPNAALAGYLLAVIPFTEALTPGSAANLLSQMLGNPGVPPERWGAIPFWLLLVSGGLGSEGQAAAARRFAELAQRNDVLAATAGLDGLAAIASSDDSLRTIIPPDALARLKSAYSGLLQKKAISRSIPLEAALGVNAGSPK